jgi:hypothetical protein
MVLPSNANVDGTIQLALGIEQLPLGGSAPEGAWQNGSRCRKEL